MASINMRLTSPWSPATTGLRREAASRWFGRAWAMLRERFSVANNPYRVLELNDHILRDIGVKRVNLEYEASFWPI